MKVTKSFLMLVLSVFLVAIVGIHWYQSRESASGLKQMELQARRQSLAHSMVLDLEKYRRASGSFRKVGEREAAIAKDTLRSQFKAKLEELDRLNPSQEEKAAATQAQDQLAELLLQSARVEPTLYARDFYIKQEGRDLHDAIVASLTRVAELAQSEQSGLMGRWKKVDSGALIAIAVSALAVTLIVAILLASHHLASVRPSRRLLEIARSLREGASAEDPGKVKPLRGLYGEIESVLRDLSATVRSQRLDRHRFIVAVAGELRPPLVALQAGMKFLEASDCSPEGSEAERRQANETVRRAMLRLSAALDDLSDLVDTEQSHLRLDEKIIDLRSLLQNMAKATAIPGADEGLKVSVPSSPIWTHLDPQRMERVLMQLIAKVAGQSGGNAEISVERRSGPAFKGLEILVQETRNGVSRAPTSPHQDVLKHWVSDSGFGMGLAQRIIQAHGGSITAAGVTGTGLQFAIRLPAERVATGGMRSLKPSSSLEAAIFGL